MGARRSLHEIYPRARLVEDGSSQDASTTSLVSDAFCSLGVGTESPDERIQPLAFHGMDLKEQRSLLQDGEEASGSVGVGFHLELCFGMQCSHIAGGPQD